MVGALLHLTLSIFIVSPSLLVIAEVSKFATILQFFIVKTPLFFIPPKTFAVIVLLFKLMVTFLLTSKLTELFSNKTISSFSFDEFIASCKEE